MTLSGSGHADRWNVYLLVNIYTSLYGPHKSLFVFHCPVDKRYPVEF